MTTPSEILVDPSCTELAEHFLADDPYTGDTAHQHEARVRALARDVQYAVEAWFERERNKGTWQ